MDQTVGQELQRLVKAWARAAYTGDSNDAEHDRGHELAAAVADLVGFDLDAYRNNLMED